MKPDLYTAVPAGTSSSRFQSFRIVSTKTQLHSLELERQSQIDGYTYSSGKSADLDISAIGTGALPKRNDVLCP